MLQLPLSYRHRQQQTNRLTDLGHSLRATDQRMALYLAIRKSTEKTVMAAKNFGESDGVGIGQADSAIEDRRALDHLFSVTYEELRRLAATVRRNDPNTTLNPTALVNEAWLKLSKSPDIGSTSPLHFKRIAARAMRQVLVEAARRRSSGKRGGGAEMTVTFDEAVQRKPSGGEEILALNTALDSLARMNPRQAVLVESRFFGGLDIPETATLLNVSEATVQRDWRAAKAWLAHELRQGL